MKKLHTPLFSVTALLLLVPLILSSQDINQNSSQYSNNVGSLVHKKITQAIIKKKKSNNGTVITNKEGGGGGGGGTGGGGCTNIYVLDKDGDGYYTDISINQCNSPGSGWVIKTTQQPGDCDDNDASINPATRWVLDADGDGYYSGDPVMQCGSPDGDGWVLYTETSNEQPGDCNDNDATINPATTWVLDNDLDGYYTGDPVTQCTSPGARWVIKTNQQPGDCDDNNPNVNPENEWVFDADGDGYYSGDPIKQCYNPGGSWVLLAGSREQPGDCDDYNYAINPATIWVLDADKDGYYSGDPVTQCTSPGDGYVIKTTQQPGDCMDNNAAVHPGAAEICGNGIDDNCNGEIDEGCAVETFTITAELVVHGSISLNPGSTVDYGGTVTATITPDLGYSVINVMVDGVPVGPQTTYTFSNVTANHTITAETAPLLYQITSIPFDQGTITPTQSVNYGNGAIVFITANPGYYITDVIVDGVSVGEQNSYTFFNVTSNHTITAATAIKTYSITTSAGAHGSITPSINDATLFGAEPITITPDAGYHVADVLVDGLSVGAVTNYTFSNITLDHTISATFAINTYTITTTPAPFGSIDASTTVNYGDSKTINITPNVGYIIGDVLVDGSSVGAQSSYTFTNVTANHTISAAFVPALYNITTSAGSHGAIVAGNNYRLTNIPFGSIIEVDIIPDAGYHVADVLVDGLSVGAVTSYTFSFVTSNHTISATFTANTAYTIKASSGANGNISPSGTISIYGGSDQTFVITANTGYHVSTVKIDGISVGAVPGYTFTSVASNHTISASFAINTYTITTSQGSDGIISPANTATVNYGSNKTYTIKPAAGYSIQDVVVDGISVGAVSNYTFTSVAANHTISASFAINDYTITSTAGENGSISPAGITSVNYGGSITYVVTPANGYHVAGVTVDGLLKGTITKYTFSNIKTNHTISAAFGINAYNITSSAGANGYISPNGVTAVNYGTSQNYTITPNTGYTVSNVVIDGTSIAATNSYTFSNVVASHRISASFICVKPALPIIAGPATVNKQQDNLVYTVTNPQPGNSYTWTVPSGVTINSGQGTAIVNIKWGNASGKLGCTASNGCSNPVKATYPVTTSSALANNLSEGDNASSIQIFSFKVNPNPVQDKAIVTFTAAAPAKYSVQVLGLTGQLLITKEVNACKGTNEINLDLSKLSNGDYFISLITGTTRKTIILIKAK